MERLRRKEAPKEQPIISFNFISKEGEMKLKFPKTKDRWSFRSLHCRLIDSIKSKIFFHQLPLVVHRSITDSRIRNEIKTIKIRLHSSPGQRQMKAKMMEWNCLKNNGMEFSCAEGWAPAITHQLPNSSSPAFHLLHLLSAN